MEKGKLSGISYLIYHRWIAPGCMLKLSNNGITAKPEVAFIFQEEGFVKSILKVSTGQFPRFARRKSRLD
ncbi:MAG TPA: hypothetical protein DCR17_08720 [Verrucomicrobiales bacterium]|nr:hypothetical protein [Verrucomicrobiales bacterium]